MKRQGVLVFGSEFGGAERRFARVASYLIKEGKPLVLLVTGDAAETLRSLSISIPDESLCIFDKVSPRNLIIKKINRFAGLLKLRFFYLKKYQVGHVHVACVPGLLTLLMSYSGVPYSLSIVNAIRNGDDKPSRVLSRLLEGIREWMLRRTLTFATAIDCLSESLGSLTVEDFDRLRISNPPPITISPCSFSDYSMTKISKRRDIDVAFIARRVPGKGFDLLQDAKPLLKGIKIFDQKTNDPFGILGRSKIFVSLQEPDNYPSQSLLEAMASECAIVATDVGNTRLLVDESCAILIPSDANALAKAIQYLLESPELVARFGAICRTKVLKEHTVAKFGNYFWHMVLKRNI